MPGELLCELVSLPQRYVNGNSMEILRKHESVFSGNWATMAASAAVTVTLYIYRVHSSSSSRAHYPIRHDNNFLAQVRFDQLQSIARNVAIIYSLSKDTIPHAAPPTPPSAKAILTSYKRWTTPNRRRIIRRKFLIYVSSRDGRAPASPSIYPHPQPE